MGAVLSSNEEYIVIAGGSDEDRYDVDIIHILDIRNLDAFILQQSKIKCPMSGNHKIFRIGGGLKDELLINGWIKKLYKLAPLDIVEVIQAFYSQESIHWIQRSNNWGTIKKKHFAIYIKDILSSLL